LREIELGGIRREHLSVRVAPASLGKVESQDTIGLGGVQLHRSDEVGHGSDIKALVEAGQAAIVESEGIVRIDVDRFAIVLDRLRVVLLQLVRTTAIVVAEGGAPIQADGLVIVLNGPGVVATCWKAVPRLLNARAESGSIRMASS